MREQPEGKAIPERTAAGKEMRMVRGADILLDTTTFPAYKAWYML
jgi:hypothetical protein